MADSKKTGAAGGSTKTTPRATAGRRARHSAQKKEPATIDLEPVKTGTKGTEATGAKGTEATDAKAGAAKKSATRSAAAKSSGAKASGPDKSDAGTKATPGAGSDAPKAATAAAPAPAATASSVPPPAKSAPGKPDDRPSPTDPSPSGKTGSDKPSSGATESAAKSAAKSAATTGTGTAASGPSGQAKNEPPKVSDRASATPAAVSSTPAAASSASAAPSSRASEKRGGTGFGPLLAAGLVGGLVTLGGAWALGAFEGDDAGLAELRTQVDGRIAAVEGAIPQAPDDALTREDVDAAIQAALAGRTADGTAEPDPRIATLQDTLTATREELAELKQSIATVGEGASDGTALAALAARIADLDGRVAAVGNTAPTSEDIQAIADRAAAGRVATVAEQATAAEGRITAAEGRVAALEQGLDGRIEERSGAAVANALAPVTQRLEALGARLDETAATVTGNGETVARLETAASELRTAVETGLSDLRTSTDETVAALRSQMEAGLEGLRSQVSEQSAALSSQDERLASQDERLARIAEQVADTDPERRAATALALANLRTRIDDGEGYGTELALVRRTNPKIDLAPLDATAEKGIPTLRALQNGWDEQADAVRAAVRPQPDAGVGGLLSNLRSVVKVKPLDGEAGDDVDATIGAVRRAIGNGDLAAADAAWQTLPEAGRKASEEWHASLSARMRAKNFLSEALASLLQETGG